MKLGSKAKDVDSFVDKLRLEGTGENNRAKAQQWMIAVLQY